MTKSVRIQSDKHGDHVLQVIQADRDNDFTVSISGTDAVTGHFVSISVVIASPGTGGGRSRETYQVIPALMAAMGEDNATESL
ncbi:MAG: hypothetical protein Q8O53_02515 [Candidatus Moranbacteria bacterium]|nr:hypothetical protein [Candidatus Moranbacteria bacterium]